MKGKLMKLRSMFVFALLAVLVVGANVGGSGQVKAQMTMTGAGCGGARCGGAPSYTGPLDVLSTNVWAAYSTRCAKSSYTGDVVDVWDAATGITTETLITCSSGGTQNIQFIAVSGSPLLDLAFYR
jgi:hypothetical protein